MSKKISIVLTIFGVFIVILLTALYFVNFRLSDLVRQRIDESLDDSWKIEFDAIDFSLFSMTFDVIGPDVSRRDSTELLWRVSAEKAEVAGIHPLQILFYKEFIADEVLLERPEVYVHKIKSDKQKHTKGSTNDLGLVVEKALIRDGILSFRNDSVGYLDTSFNLETGKLEFGNQAVDPLKLSESVYLQLSDLSYSNRDSTELLSILEVTKNRDSELIIDSLSWIPQLSLKDFSDYHGWRKSRTTAKVNRIEAEMPTMRSDSAYTIGKICISGADIDLEKDLSYDLPSRETSLPQDILKELDLKFSIDSIAFNQSNLAVKLHREKGLVAQLSFKDIQGSAYATNLPKAKTALGFTSKASTLNGSSLEVRSEYYYDTNNPWVLSGSMTDTELEFFSDFLRKMAGVEIASGKLNQLKFDMEGNNQINEGTVSFLYDNLSIVAVHKETGKKKVVLNVLTDVLGALVFWKQNPTNGNTRIGEFSVERDPRRAFPSQWIQGLMSGLLETVAKVDPMKINRNHHKEKRK